MAISLESIWSAATALGARTGKEPRYALDEWGLYLEMPPKRWEYFCTPKNSVTFGSTGGDGVHFGLLELAGMESHQRPVVMTVPMSDRHNVVIAETLGEFLNIGFHVGWFSLEQIVYNPDEAVEYHADADPEDWPEHIDELVFFRESLGLTYQPLSLARIAALEEKYHPLLIADDEPPE